MSFLFNHIEHVSNSSEGKSRNCVCVYLALPTQFDEKEYLPCCLWPQHGPIRNLPSLPHLFSYYYLTKKLGWSLRHDKIEGLLFTCYCCLFVVCNFFKSILLVYHWEHIWISAYSWNKIVSPDVLFLFCHKHVFSLRIFIQGPRNKLKALGFFKFSHELQRPFIMKI